MQRHHYSSKTAESGLRRPPFQRGFTHARPEIPIAVALVGIIAAITIPAYQDYQTLTRTDKLIRDYTDKPVHAISESFNKTGRLPDKTELARLQAIHNGIAIDVESNITLPLKGKNVDRKLTGLTIQLSPTIQGGDLSWSCSAGKIESNIERHLPKRCRSASR